MAEFKRQFKVNGLKEMERSLKKLPDNLRDKALKNASAAGARVIRKEAIRLAPSRTGRLKDNIVVSRSFKQRGRRVRLKGAVVIGIRGVSRYYAHLVEFGFSRGTPQPFMRPAFDNKADEALRAIAKKLSKEIVKQAKKLTGWKPAKKIKRLTR